ncbi:MAG: M48 family metallopeptidase [Fimbriimonadaceae bacterium]
MEDRAAQIQKGNQWAEQFVADARSSGKKLNADYAPAAYERIRRIFSRLHQVSHVRDEQWTPVLVEEKVWNAFTTGGTYFVINSGLENDLKDDAELANVIAHEMAHTVANHVFEGQSYMQLNALSGSKSARRDTFQAAFTHEGEAEADRIAVLYCSLAGFDPYAGSRIWQRMHQKTGNDALFVHDHPMNSERAAQAQEMAAKVARYYIADQLNPDYLSILQRNEIFDHQTEPDIELGKGGGFVAALEATVSTMNQQQQAKREEQRQQNRMQFMQSVHQVSSIVSSGAVSPTRWRVTVRYGGNRALTDLSFKLIVKRIGSEPLEIAQQLSGVLYPNNTFYVDFESPELNAYSTSAQNVMFLYDNARGL